MSSSPKHCILKLDRWLSLSASMILMSCAGLTYTFAVYSEHMKQKLHYSQEDIDDIGAAKDLGSIIGLPSGILYSFCPPWVTVFLGALLHFTGYNMMWMTVSGKVKPSFWLLCIYSAVGTGGDSWFDTACMMTSLQNFEEHRGTAMGILKAQLGISSAIFVMMYEVMFAPNVDNFLLLMAVVPTFAAFLLAYFITPNKYKDDHALNASFRLKMMIASVIILGIYLMIAMSTKEYFEVNRSYQLVIVTVLIIIMLTMYIVPVLPFRLHKGEIPLSIHKKVSVEKKEDEEDEDEEEVEHLLDLKTHTFQVEFDNNVRELNLADCMRDANFWLIVSVITIGAGAGVAIINNFAQIGKSMGSSGTDFYVGVISIWSCFGRLISGYGSDVLMRNGFARPICLLITQILMSLCCLILATGLVPLLLIGSALTGLTYGSYWTLCPAILSDIFGVDNFAALYKILSLLPPVGSYILSVKVVGYLYDMESTSGDDDNDDHVCYGRKCFGWGLVALSVISIAGAFISWVLFLRTNSQYSSTSKTKRKSVPPTVLPDGFERWRDF